MQIQFLFKMCIKVLQQCIPCMHDNCLNFKYAFEIDYYEYAIFIKCAVYICSNVLR